MKLRLLFCTESSFLSTGYATYAREMLSRLHETGLYEIAEFGCYATSSDPRAKSIPWKFYGNLPENEHEKAGYDSQAINVFGAWRFDDIVLDFMPHVVFSYRDFWMDEHQLRSPLRKYFHLIWMPTVDAYPQNKQWIAGQSSADAVFTYTDWARDVLVKQTNGALSPINSLTAGADKRLKPVANKLEHKAKYGLQDYKIVGTVMRNQRRKLFPDLFEGFKKFLDSSGRTDVLLYCHTSYPDKHPWNIPELLNEFELCSKVIFTYKCKNCQNTFMSFFSDVALVCNRCNQPTANTANVQQGCSVEFLNEVYNIFDLYIQYANSEGQGLPAWEAAACGVPLAVVDYSGMCDAVKYLNAHPLKVKALYRELETGCFRAIPDNDYLASFLEKFFERSDLELAELSKKTLDQYNTNCGYDKAASKLSAYLDTLNVDKLQQNWLQPPHIVQPAKEIPNIPNSEFTNWLITNVLCEPNKLGSYMHARLNKDINYGFSTGGMGGFYLNENSMFFVDNHVEEFNREKAFEHFTNLRHYFNHWEEKRINRINAK